MRKLLATLALVLLASAGLGAQGRLRQVSATSIYDPYVTFDSFTDTAATDLASHTGQKGATWAEQTTAATGSMVVTDANRVRLATAGVNENYYSSGVPACNDYDVQTNFRVFTVVAGHFYSLWGRMQPSADTGYFVLYDVPSTQWSLHKVIASVDTVLGTPVTQALTPGATYSVKLELRPTVKTVYINGVSIITSPDDTITGIGRGGFGGFVASPAPTNTTGIHYDDFTVTDYAGDCDPVPPVLTGVAVNPGDDIQALITANPTNTTFVLASGTYRLQSLTPKNGDIFTGAGVGLTVLRGANAVSSSGWTPSSGGRFFKGSQTQTQTTSVPQFCMTGAPKCGINEEMFRDGTRLGHVASAALVTTGKWYFDDGADIIWVGDDPSGHSLELGATTRAFGGSVDDVIIQDMTVEMYASPAQRGCINSGTASHWTVRRVTVQNCHGVGLETGTNAVVQDVRALHNGQMGFAGGGSGLVLEYSESAYNDEAFYNPGWEAGGSKWAGCSSCTIRYSYFHDNWGPGIWFDINNNNIIIEYNTVDDNKSPSDTQGGDSAQAPGIFAEISQAFTVRYNLVRRNGLGNVANAYGFGACVVFASSGGYVTGGIGSSEVYNNICEDNDTGISLLQQNRAGDEHDYGGPWANVRTRVHHNTIVYNVVTNYATGIYWDGGVSDPYNNSNTYDNNTYYTNTNGAGDFHYYTGSFFNLSFTGWAALWTGETKSTYGSYTHTAAGANGAGPR